LHDPIQSKNTKQYSFNSYSNIHTLVTSPNVLDFSLLRVCINDQNYDVTNDQ